MIAHGEKMALLVDFVHRAAKLFGEIRDEPLEPLDVFERFGSVPGYWTKVVNACGMHEPTERELELVRSVLVRGAELDRTLIKGKW